ALAHVLGVAEENVRVTQLKKGGAFGGDSDISEIDLCAAKLAQVTERPVKMQYTREEVFTFHRGRHTTSIQMRLAMDAGGRVLGVESDILLDGGAFASFGPITVYYLLQLLGAPVKIGAYRARSRRIYTNKPPQGPKRGHGTPQPRFAFETLLDAAAARLGLDPLDVRRRGAIAAGEEMVNGFHVPSSGILECLRVVEEASGWKSRHELPHGFGLGCAVGAYISGTAGAILGQRDDAQSNVTMTVKEDGQLYISSQANDIGQGLEMMLILLAEGETGIARERIIVTTGDTAHGPVDLGAYSSRCAFMLGTAAVNAAREIRRELDRGVRTPTCTGTYFTIPVKAGGHEYRGNTIGASPTYSMTAVVALVFVDDETGEVRVDHVWAAHDCGKPINPSAVHGQIQGSVSMGDSEARFECMTYNSQGLLEQPNLLLHGISTALDGPEITSFIVETQDPMSPHGAKEAGEGPLLPVAPAIGNAIAHATGGAVVREMPFTGTRVLTAIRAKGRR
ncbi:molybdopterin-dependent oxidoreductase, partial [Candidatus Uhrbacteria bacterium]|nr:molybdopterin-dependent oxidoreductase [Candidatus Uhrbacteria bacterium]